jgi:toxin secretion/phage lysis holin
MAIDYLTGILVAAVFHKSSKSKTGALDSKAGWKGLTKKGMVLLIVLIAHRLDLVIGSTFVKDAVTIAYIANETISIVENAGLMGLPIPSVITNAIEVLKQKSDDPEGENDK